MTQITLVNIQIPGYVHSAAYADLVTSVRCGLIALGHGVTETPDFPLRTGNTIVFGAHLLSHVPVFDLPERVIIYNTEHAESPSLKSAAYLQILRYHDVWDYSADNTAALSKILGKPVRYVPFGYVPELTRITPAAEQDIDVLFYGSMNERRQQIIDELREAGLKVEALFGVYGADLDPYIARAKVVLNMHYYMPGHFEALRVGFLLANKVAVVCESNEGEDFPPALLGLAMMVSYEKIVQIVVNLCTLADHRRSLGQRTFDAFAAMGGGEPAILRAALAATWGETVKVLTEGTIQARGVAIAAVDNSPSAFDSEGAWTFSWPELRGIDLSKTDGLFVPDKDRLPAGDTTTLFNAPIDTAWGTTEAMNMTLTSGTIEVQTFPDFMLVAPSRIEPPPGAPPIPKHLIVGSGKAFDHAALNLDCDYRWKPDICADISDPDRLLGNWWPSRFGSVQMGRGAFTKITASHVLEHIPNLVQTMTNCLELLADGGEMHITVPYDLSYGAWQDPTHVRAFNERSWLYYTDWHWYLDWNTHRFDKVSCEFWSINHGRLTQTACLTPRAVDEMRVVLRKRPLTDAEKVDGEARQGGRR